MKFVSWTFIALCMIAMACDDESESPDSSEFPDLRIYLDRFEQEAKEKGYVFDLSNVQAVYVDAINLNNVTYCGYGFSNYDGNGKRRIEISRAGHCGWSTMSDIQRENFVFHEIGHAFFNRGHDDATLCDGSVASLMTGGPNQRTVYMESSGDKRDYYIRELIDPLEANTQCLKDAKDWSKDPIFYQITNDYQDWTLSSDNGKKSGTQGGNDAYLTINTAQVNTYWHKTFNSPIIPECAEVKFRVKMNSESIIGKGAAIAIRLYKSRLTKQGAITEQYLFVSTENDPVAGEVNDGVKELAIPCYSRSTTQMVIFAVLLGESQGEVRFDDIELLVHPQ